MIIFLILIGGYETAQVKSIRNKIQHKNVELEFFFSDTKLVSVSKRSNTVTAIYTKLTM